MPKPPPDPDTLVAALPELLQPLARRAAIVRFARHQLLIREGDFGDTLYIVLAGEVSAFSASADDSKRITFGTYGPGEYVGEMSLDGGRRSASVEATQATCCAMVTRRTLTHYIAERPEFAFALLSKVIWRARVATSNARLAVMSDSYERLRLVLETLARAGPDGPRCITPRPTQLELAQRALADRTTVTKLMKALRAGGYVQEEPGALRLLRPLPARW